MSDTLKPVNPSRVSFIASVEPINWTVIILSGYVTPLPGSAASRWLTRFQILMTIRLTQHWIDIAGPDDPGPIDRLYRSYGWYELRASRFQDVARCEPMRNTQRRSRLYFFYMFFLSTWLLTEITCIISHVNKKCNNRVPTRFELLGIYWSR